MAVCGFWRDTWWAGLNDDLQQLCACDESLAGTLERSCKKYGRSVCSLQAQAKRAPQTTNLMVSCRCAVKVILSLGGLTCS